MTSDKPPDYSEVVGRAGGPKGTAFQQANQMNAYASTLQQVPQHGMMSTLGTPTNTVVPFHGYATNVQQMPASHITCQQTVQYIRQPQTQTQLNTPVVIQSVSSQPIPERFSIIHPFRLGIAQLVATALIIVLYIVGIVIEAAQQSVGHGFWCGIFVSACLAMNIVSAFFALCGFGISIGGVASDSSRRQCDNFRDCSYYPYTEGLAVNICLLLLFLAEIIVSITTSVYCCAGGGCGAGNHCCSCCYSPPQTGIMLGNQTLAYPAGSVIPSSTGNTILVVNSANNSNYDNLNNSNNSHNSTNSNSEVDHDIQESVPYKGQHETQGNPLSRVC